jgi:hypothetical protein
LRIPVKLLAALFIITLGLPIVRAQEPPSTDGFIGYALNEINNFQYNAQQYWFNISQAVLYESFSDIHDARSLIGIAQSYVEKNDTVARLFAAQASFVAKRANYRLFVSLASNVLRDANQTVSSIPSYIPKPPDAVENLNKAAALNRTTVINTAFIPGQPEDAWRLLDAMQRSIDQLWYDKECVAALARLAKKEALDYLAQQTPIKKREMDTEFASLNSRSILQVVIPLVFSIVVATPTYFMLRRRLLGWVKNLANLKWSGYLFQRRIMGSLLVGAVVSLAVAAGNLVTILFDLNAKLQFYQLGSRSGMYLAQILSYSAIVIAIIVAVLVILNGATPRHRLLTGITALSAFVVGFLALVLAWSLTLSALLF